MDQRLFDAVFIRGIVGNQTTRYLLSTSVLQEYTWYCERLVTDHPDLPRDQLYERSADFLRMLLDDSGHLR